MCNTYEAARDEWSETQHSYISFFVLFLILTYSPAPSDRLRHLHDASGIEQANSSKEQ